MQSERGHGLTRHGDQVFTLAKILAATSDAAKHKPNAYFDLVIDDRASAKALAEATLARCLHSFQWRMIRMPEQIKAPETDLFLHARAIQQRRRLAHRRLAFYADGRSKAAL